MVVKGRNDFMNNAETIIDANLTLEEVLKNKQALPAPQEVLSRQRMIEVTYYSFDGLLHQGQIVVDVDLAEEVREAFHIIETTKFPVKSVIPFVDRRFMSEEERAASMNNSSAFNYRLIAGSDKLSNHAYGRAFDINPALNPLLVRGEEVISLKAKRDVLLPGTIVGNEEFVTYLKSKGWEWGGDWIDRKDYMHLEKS
jgi:peptidoglycan LD-endopeptidase CwlK